MSSEIRPCFVCKLPNLKVLAARDYGDKLLFECQKCGRYKISRTAEHTIGDQPLDSISGWIRERNLWGEEPPILNSDLIAQLVAELPKYGPLEKQRKLLGAIELLTSQPGKSIGLNLKRDSALAWTTDKEEFEYYVQSLIQRGILSGPNANQFATTDPTVPVTVEGWEYLERHRWDFTNKRQGFVAMSFDVNLKYIFDNALAPAIDGCGYDPYRVDSKPHLDRIDAKIIAEIKNSRFLVADVTQQRPGVYYEAGFAHGLGMPVIWSVHRDEIDDVHFDTRQYSHILWEDEAGLQKELSEVIAATIGKFKSTSDDQ